MYTRKMYTRKEYLDGQCTFQQYYEQFADSGALSRVLQSIGRERILASKDEHFNDIPLELWQNIYSGSVPFPMAAVFKRAEDYPTEAGLVCACKAAAQKIREGRA